MVPVFSVIANVDWWKGEGSGGHQGIFPSNYVRKIEGNSEKGVWQGDKAPYAPHPQYGYQQYPGQQQYPPPNYGQAAPYQAQPQEPAPVVVQQQQQPQKHSKLADFGKNYGKTFVNATAW
jgi:hypothetical protein